MRRKVWSTFICALIVISVSATISYNEGQTNPEPSSGGSGDLAVSPWPMFGFNAQRTGLSLYSTSTNMGDLRWSFETEHTVESPVIGSDGTIYVGSSDKLYAINPDGTEKWNVITGSIETPAIGSDGTIYAGSKSNDMLYAINADGTEKWRFITSAQIKSSLVIDPDGTIYFGTANIPFLYALNPDGTEKWRFNLGTDGQASSPGVDNDGTIYVGSSDFNLYAINPDGTEKWRFPTGDNVQSAPTIDTDGTIYVGSRDHNLYAINPDGTEKWRFVTGGSIGWHTSASIGPDGTIYIDSSDQNLYAINPDGTEKWRFTSAGGVQTAPAIGSEGTIYVGSNDDNLYAINPDGTQKWNFLTGWYVHSSPAIGFDGTVYVGSWDHKLYAIGGIVHPWPMFHHNPGHTGQSPYDTSANNGQLKWDLTTGDRVISSPVIGHDGTIYVGSYDYKLYAINPDGIEKWNFNTGGEVFSSPTIGSDRTIYVGSLNGNFYAINPDGTEKWYFTSGYPIRSSPVIGSDGTIYFGSDDYKIYGINPDGTEKWSFITGYRVKASPAIGTDGTIYVASCDYNLYAINPDGTEKWNFMTGNEVHSSPAIGSDGVIYVGSSDGKLYAINQDGTMKWCYTTGGNVYSSPAIGNDGTIYVGSFDNKLYSITQDGFENWNFLIDDDIHTSPAVGFDGTIYFGSDNHIFYALNPDGTEKWNFITDGDVFSSPAIDTDGTIYVGSYDNKLYAIGNPGLDVDVTSHFSELNSAAQSAITVHVTDGTNPVQGVTVNLDSDNGGIFNPQSGITDANGDFESIFNAPTVTTQIICKISAGASKTDYNDGSGYVDVTINPIPWPMFRHNPGHTGQSPYDTSANNGNLKWSFTTGNWVWSSPAIGSDGTIYVGSWDNNLYAINPDGTEKWNFPTGDIIWSSSPTIDSDGTILIGSDDNNLYAINPDGTEKWKFTTGDRVRSSPTIGSDGTIYIGSYDNNLYAINPDGTIKWSFNSGWNIQSSPAVGYDGTIFFGSQEGTLYALNPDGTEKWNFKTFYTIDSSPAIGHDGTIYIGSASENLYAINPDGTEKWKFTTSINSNIHSSPAIGSDGTIYVGCDDGRLYSINPDGTGKWIFMTGNGILSSPAIGSDGTIYISSYDNNLYAINPDGSEKWHFTTGNWVYSSPAIGSDGTIYIGSYDNKLYAIGGPAQNQPPVADAGSDQTVNEGATVQFDGSASNDPDSTIESYEWDFDASDGLWWDTGAVPDANGPTPTHVFGDDGVYTVTLRVTDDTSDTDTDICIVIVNNVAPTITLLMTYPDDEGSRVTFEAESIDPGSDDLTYSWDIEFGPTIENTYYNDWIGPEPLYDPMTNEIKTPSGNFPFHTSDVETHVYGDNFDYTITLTVTDDDGGVSTATTTVSVNNLAPSIIEINMPSQVDEGSYTLFEVLASDEGSDDLTFTWDWGDGTSSTSMTYHNDGTGSDPYPSPWGTSPFTATDSAQHTYGDNGVFTITLIVEDDDEGMDFARINITVNNVAPSITSSNYTILMVNEPRTIGYWGHQCEVVEPYGDHTGILQEWIDIISSQSQVFSWISTKDDVESIVQDGDASDMIVMAKRQLMGVWLNVVSGKLHPATEIYMPNLMASKTVWETILGIENVIQISDNRTELEGVKDIADNINNGNGIALGIVEFTASATDPGADDLTFHWDFGDGTSQDNFYPNPGGVFPINASDNVVHSYFSLGTFTVALTVADDDGGTTTTTIVIVLPG